MCVSKSSKNSSRKMLDAYASPILVSYRSFRGASMNHVVGSSVPADAVTPRAATSEVSLFRLYSLRLAYFIMAAGLGVYIWPHVIHHSNEYAAAYGIQRSE